MKSPLFQEKFPLKVLFNRTIFFSLGLMVGVILAGELVLHFLVNIAAIRPLMVGSQNAEMDIKLSMMDQIVAEGNRIDCIFLGSSQFDAAIDPEVFSKTYAGLSGDPCTCFNFSVATLTASPAGKIAQILVNRYHPRLLIYGTSARDYSTNFGEWARPLLDDPWIRYQSGSFNLRGWLVDHSFLARLLVGIGKSFDPDYGEFQSRLAVSLSRYGYLAGDGNNLDNPKENFIPRYERSIQDMAGLDEILRLKMNGVQLIIFEVPVHESFLLHYVEANPEAYELLFVSPVSDYVRGRGIPFWRTMGNDPPLIPDSGWSDVKHLNDTGARILSAWLGERLFAAVSSGEIQDPFR